MLLSTVMVPVPPDAAKTTAFAFVGTPLVMSSERIHPAVGKPPAPFVHASLTLTNMKSRESRELKNSVRGEAITLFVFPTDRTKGEAAFAAVAFSLNVLSKPMLYKAGRWRFEASLPTTYKNEAVEAPPE